MNGRPEIRIKAYDFQKMVEDFTLNHRDFTAFSSTKLDHIFRFYVPDASSYMYSKYDAENEEVVFRGPWDINLDPEFAKMLENVRVREINRPLEIKLLKG